MKDDTILKNFYEKLAYCDKNLHPPPKKVISKFADRIGAGYRGTD